MRGSRSTTSISIAAVVSASLLLAACGSSDSAEQVAAGQPVELSVSLFGTFGLQEAGLFDEYEKAHPGVTIKYESTQGEDKYWPALQTKLASGTGVSDIQGIEVARIADVTANQSDKWSDLKKTSAGAAVANYVDWKAAAATTKDGAVLGMGTDIGPMALCYRSDLMAKAGLPADPAKLSAELGSWDDYLALGEKYKDKAPKGSAWTDSAGGLYNAIISTEKEIYYDEAGKVVYDSNPAVKKAFTTAAGAAQSGLTARLEQFVDPGWDAGFGSGTFATIACPSWMIGYIKGKAGAKGEGKWDVTSLPGGAGGNWGGAYLAIPEVSKHKAAAAELITWLTAPEQQAKVFAKAGAFPSTTKGIELVATTTDPYFHDAPIGELFTKSAKAAPTQILGPNDGVIKSKLVQALLSVEANGVSPDKAWANAAKEIDNQIG